MKRSLRRGLRFGMTVLCSALLANAIQAKWAAVEEWADDAQISLVRRWNSLWGTGGAVAAINRDAPPAPVALTTEPEDRWSRELSEFYSKYLIEIMKALRANKSVRIVKLDVPHTALNFQRNLATLEKGGESLRLQARYSMIPVVAVSRNTKPYLEEMRVTYIDPQGLPARFIQSASLTLAPKALHDYLLIPDLSGRNARKFQFGKR